MDGTGYGTDGSSSATWSSSDQPRCGTPLPTDSCLPGPVRCCPAPRLKPCSSEELSSERHVTSFTAVTTDHAEQDVVQRRGHASYTAPARIGPESSPLPPLGVSPSGRLVVAPSASHPRRESMPWSAGQEWEFVSSSEPKRGPRGASSSVPFGAVAMLRNARQWFGTQDRSPRHHHTCCLSTGNTSTCRCVSAGSGSTASTMATSSPPASPPGGALLQGAGLGAGRGVIRLSSTSAYQSQWGRGTGESSPSSTRWGPPNPIYPTGVGKIVSRMVRPVTITTRGTMGADNMTTGAPRGERGIILADGAGAPAVVSRSDTAAMFRPAL